MEIMTAGTHPAFENRYLYHLSRRSYYCKHFGNFSTLSKKKPPWPESASELYRAGDRGLLAKLVPTFVDQHTLSCTK
jgi:hypothetical protein